MPVVMTVERAKQILVDAGEPVIDEKRLGNDLGTQLVVSEAFVNVYDKGTYNVQGKRAQEVKYLLDSGGSPVITVKPKDHQPAPSLTGRRVFVVYGRDQESLDDLELLLRRLKFEPIILQNLPAGGDTIIEKLENSTDAEFACVLLTPDDEGRLKPKNGIVQNPLRARARQNVVLEMGMVLSKLGRERVALIVHEVNGSEIEPPGDLGGILYLPFESKVDEVKNGLAAWLEKLGFHISVADLQA